MDAEACQIAVKMTGHWVNCWFLYFFAAPSLWIDDQELEIIWRVQAAYYVPAGRHVVTVAMRYAASRPDLGATSLAVDLAPGEVVSLTGRASWLNQGHFALSVVDDR